MKGKTIKMNNIIFEKVWQDNNLIELKISASCEFASAYQSCYIEDKKLEEIAEEICAFARNFNKSCYLEFGEKGVIIHRLFQCVCCLLICQDKLKLKLTLK